MENRRRAWAHVAVFFVFFGVGAVYTLYRLPHWQGVSEEPNSTREQETVSAIHGSNRSSEDKNLRLKSSNKDAVVSSVTLNAKADAENSPIASDSIDIMEERFSPPLFEAPEKFKVGALPVDFSSSCKKEDQFEDMNVFLKSKFGLQGDDLFPNQGQIDVLSIFWTKDNRYFQVSAQSELTDPPSYQLIYATSMKKSFDDDVEVLSDGEIQENAIFSLNHATKIMRRIFEKAKQEGAILGGRIVGYRQLDSEQKNLADVTFLNGNPIYVNYKNLWCQSQKSGGRAKCHCDFN